MRLGMVPSGAGWAPGLRRRDDVSAHCRRNRGDDAVVGWRRLGPGPGRGDRLAAGGSLDVRGCALSVGDLARWQREGQGIEADIDVPFSDAVKDLSFGAMLLVDARKGRFGIAANGVFTRVSPDEKVGPIKIDVTTDLAQLGVG